MKQRMSFGFCTLFFAMAFANLAFTQDVTVDGNLLMHDSTPTVGNSKPHEFVDMDTKIMGKRSPHLRTRSPQAVVVVWEPTSPDLARHRESLNL